MSASEEITQLENYKDCPKCGIGFEHLTLGGVGTWRNTIMCNACGHVQKGLDFKNVIAPLIAERWGTSVEHQIQAQKESERIFDEKLERARSLADSVGGAF